MTSILVVDDDELVRSFLVDCLIDAGYDVRSAGDGEEAKKLAKQSPMDILVTDLVMPGKNGIDLIMEIKNEMPDLRIVAVSGGGGITGKFDYLPIAKLVGAKHVLQKPVSPEQLVATVRDCES